MRRHLNDHIEYFHEYGIHVPSRTLTLDSSIDDEGDEHGVSYVMANKFIKNMHILMHISKDPITIILNTEGGDIYQGMAIYDAICASSAHVTIKVIGNAQSMGSIILQAGDERILSPNSVVMFHSGASKPNGGNPYESYNSAKFDLDFGNKIDNILFERIKEKFDKENKAFTKQRFTDMNLKGRYLTAEEALELGLATKIL